MRPNTDESFPADSARRGFRSSRWSHGYATLVGGLALMLFGLSCGGDEPRERAEQAREPAQSSEANPRRRKAPESRTLQTIARGVRQPNARPLVWVAVEDADRLVLVDLARGEVRARHRTPGGPHNITVASDGTAAATLYASDDVAFVRRARAQVLDLGGTPHDVKSTGSLFVVANEAARRIDLITAGKHGGSIQLKTEPHDLAIAPGGSMAWVTLNGSDELAVVDLRARRLVRYVKTGRRPHDILFAPGGRLWLTDWAGPVHVFDRRGRLRGSIKLARESHHLTFTPDGREAWITDHGAEQIFIVDTRSLRRIASLRVRGAPHHVAITPDGALAAVADHENGMVAVYDVGRRTLVRAVRVGAGPHGIWAVPANRS